MKNIFFFLIFSSMTIMLSTSCEQAELLKSNESLFQVVETRSIEDCEECPVEDCCCTVTVLTDIPVIQSIPLVFCGTTSPWTTSPCSVYGLGNCPDLINAQSEQITLLDMERRAKFCAAQGQIFGITSFPIYPGVILEITCQTDSISPQTVYVDLGAIGTKPYWQINGECELEPCF